MSVDRVGVVDHVFVGQFVHCVVDVDVDALADVAVVVAGGVAVVAIRCVVVAIVVVGLIQCVIRSDASENPVEVAVVSVDRSQSCYYLCYC